MRISKFEYGYLMWRVDGMSEVYYFRTSTEGEYAELGNDMLFVLNTLGECGWELISKAERRTTMWFKRKK